MPPNMSLQNGSLKQHHLTHHGAPPTREELVKGTTILAREPDAKRLAILEAILIKERSPSLNLQCFDLLILPTARTMPPPP